MQRVSLSELLCRATPYREWRAPVDRRLHLSLVLSGASVSIVLVGATLLWLIGPRWSAGPALVMVTLNLTTLAALAGLVIGTDGLRKARTVCLWSAFGVVLVGALNALLLALAGAVTFVGLSIMTARMLSRAFGLGALLVPMVLVMLAPLPAIAVWQVVRALRRLDSFPGGAEPAGGSSRPMLPAVGRGR